MIIAARTYTSRACEPRAQQLRDLVAAAQVLGVLGAEPAEVDDAARRPAPAAASAKLTAAWRSLAAKSPPRAHRVDEVVGGLDALERLGQALAREDVALARVAPARAAAAEGADACAAGLQFVDQLGADVAGGAGDEDGVGFAHERSATRALVPGIPIGRSAVGCPGSP